MRMESIKHEKGVIEGGEGEEVECPCLRLAFSLRLRIASIQPRYGVDGPRIMEGVPVIPLEPDG